MTDGALYIVGGLISIGLSLILFALQRIAAALEERNSQTFKDK